MFKKREQRISRNPTVSPLKMEHSWGLEGETTRRRRKVRLKKKKGEQKTANGKFFGDSFSCNHIEVRDVGLRFVAPGDVGEEEKKKYEMQEKKSRNEAKET